MNDESKEQLIAQFRAYLEFTDTIAACTNETDGRTIDLYTLFCELAALKNEVKLESRQVKQALQQFTELFNTLQDENARLRTEISRSQTDKAALREAAHRELLIEMLELRDRLIAGVESARKKRTGLLGRLGKGDARVHALLEGMEITLQRLDSVLQRYEVTPIDALGEPFDPKTMRAVEVERGHDEPDGTVIAELRKGFVQNETVLRVAEVTVNRGETPHE